MAGDWIKIRTDLYEDAAVMKLSDILATDDPTTVGLLVRFWSWADRQTPDGADIAISSARLDRLIGREGFAEGMRLIGWLSGRDGSLCLPRFERHNGSSAKARALEAEAKRFRRANEKEKLSDTPSDNCPTPVRRIVRPEKRREEKKKDNPLPPDGGEGEGPRILPKGWKNMPQREQKLTKVLANSPSMIRIGSWFGRRPDTLWTIAEAAALLMVRPEEPDVELMARYYEAVLPAERDSRRRDLQTLLNNWSGELDRARVWTLENP